MRKNVKIVTTAEPKLKLELELEQELPATTITAAATATTKATTTMRTALYCLSLHSACDLANI